MFSPLLAVALAALACLLAPPMAVAADPSRPLTIVVPYAEGSTTDTIGRILAAALERAMPEHRVRVENVVGAGGTVGLARVARASPDGMTLLLIDNAIATMPSLYRKLAFDPLRDFAPIGLVDDMPLILAGRAGLPLRDRAQLLGYLRGNRRRVTVADAGPGSPSQMCAMLIAASARLEFGSASYKGSPPALTDIINGRVDLLCDTASAMLAAIRKRSVQALAVSTGRRIALLPELPSLDELGFKGFDMSYWHVLLAPRALPNDSVDKLQGALQTALEDPSVRRSLNALGSSPVPAVHGSAAAAQARISAELSKWSPIIYKAGLVAD